MPTPEDMREHMLGKKYGMTQLDFAYMLLEQDDRCPICGKYIGGAKEKANGSLVTEAHVDHNHTTGKVRALLCGQCNTGLGMFGDNPERIYSAYRYLQEWERKHQEQA